ncbi:LysR family substrate-binding domain-containing protein [Microbacterium sp. BWT-B31]|uniref:LysR family substrate-binding domain-containing protein n=1 Tax=Microbacterium sp. BWT-B31 TaxID=3232072 RepID=UPI0035291971
MSERYRPRPARAPAARIAAGTLVIMANSGARGRSGAQGGRSGAQGGGRSGKGAGSRRQAAKGAARGGRGAKPGAKPDAKPPGRAAPRPPANAEPPETLPDRFTLGVVPGATPGKWIDAWRKRMPQVELELRHIAVADQRDALQAPGSAELLPLDAALVRLPIDRSGLSVIALYDEVPVVVVSAQSHLTAADELDLADLAGEVAVVPRDDVLALDVPGAVAASFDPPADTAEAIATVAAGIGFVVVPMSLARLHHRKDVEHRPLRGAPVSTVALAWPADRTTPLVEVFVGIVRGRTANSSR